MPERPPIASVLPIGRTPQEKVLIVEMDHGKKLEQSTLRLWRGEVLPEWLDYNGHMTEHRYLQVFGESSDAVYDLIGVDFSNAAEGAFFTLATHIWHRTECKLGTPLWSETEILGHDSRFLHLFHRLYDADRALLAEGEHLAIHVRHGKSEAAPAEMLLRIAQIFISQAKLPVPEHAGLVLKRPLQFSRTTGTVAIAL